MPDSTELLHPRGPGREPRELLRDRLADRQEGRQRAVDAEVGETRFPEEPIPAREHLVDHPEVLVHVLAELGPPHLQDMPRPSGPGLHLLEHQDRKSTRLNSSHTAISYA